MSGALLAPPPLRRRSSNRPSPFPTGGSAGPSRPGMSRTYSFCATSPADTYASAASSSKPSVRTTPKERERQRERQRQSSKKSTAAAIPMERSISSLGLDGVQLGHCLQARKQEVPSIIIQPDLAPTRAHMASPYLYSSPYSADSTPGPLTPGTPFGMRPSSGEAQITIKLPDDQAADAEGEQYQEMGPEGKAQHT